MARRSGALRSGAGDDPAMPQDTDHPDAMRGRRPWAGAGGRWWVWVGRAFLWALLLVILVNGIWWPLRAGVAFPVLGAPDDGSAAQSEEETDSAAAFPESAAADFAARFAQVYLSAPEPDDGDADDGDAAATTGTAGSQERSEELTAFLPEGTSSGFDPPAGSELDSGEVHVLGVTAHSANDGLVRLAVSVNDTRMALDVPVFADDSSLVVSGQPALVAAPEVAALPEPADVDVDPEAREELETDLAEFFESYADGDLSQRYLDDAASVSPLPAGAVNFVELEEVVVPYAAGGEGEDVREARVTVVWELADSGDSPAQLTQSYALTVVRDGSEWYVRDIQGAPHSFGS
ncbi:conjugal transfer protein [Lipingzhangella sp. LS1_29]|uniref:Conjugal transfer protein n=1 Tax=Lipingzhangella rawalii TaxID=2055835 RepID=A0ABU2HCL8_9ACTN|nr:conjugal transfer protein [Lipingzhangella rawalii]MDS1272314.1 conjugal transfer protein [Lipingzhangella rawalii]